MEVFDGGHLVVHDTSFGLAVPPQLGGQATTSGQNEKSLMQPAWNMSTCCLGLFSFMTLSPSLFFNGSFLTHLAHCSIFHEANPSMACPKQICNGCFLSFYLSRYLSFLFSFEVASDISLHWTKQSPGFEHHIGAVLTTM